MGELKVCGGWGYDMGGVGCGGCGMWGVCDV